MVAEVGVHDDHVVAGCVLQAVHVGRSQAQFAGARVQFDVHGAHGCNELFGDVLGTVGGAVVDYDYFPVEVSVGFV